MTRANRLLSYDLCERHHVVARLIMADGRADARVLDVGGGRACWRASFRAG